MLMIRGSRVIDPESGLDRVTDILADETGILKIGDMAGEDIPEKALVIDGTGLITGPGLVDVHVHFRDPGLTYKEDISTGAAAAAAGGYTTVVCMANTKPCVDTADTLRYVLEEGKKTGIRVLSCAAVTRGLKGTELTDMEALAEAGAAGFTDDGIPVKNGEILREALVRAEKLGLPVSLHEEDPAFILNNGINRGPVSEQLGIGGSPDIAEYSMVARDCAIASSLGAKLNIQHISSGKTVEIIRMAKAAGVPVWAEATPHHFTLTEMAVLEYGSMAKMNPPLRTEDDRMAIIRGLEDGTIDIIATDHAPHSAEEKAKPLTEAPSGIIGLETALGLAVTELVETGYLTWTELFTKMSLNPARLYGLEAGKLAEGAPADLVILDPAGEFTAGPYRSKAENSPFTGRSLRGKVCFTVCGGRIVYRAE